MRRARGTLLRLLIIAREYQTGRGNVHRKKIYVEKRRPDSIKCNCSSTRAVTEDVVRVPAAGPRGSGLQEPAALRGVPASRPHRGYVLVRRQFIATTTTTKGQKYFTLIYDIYLDLYKKPVTINRHPLIAYIATGSKLNVLTSYLPRKCYCKFSPPML